MATVPPVMPARVRPPPVRLKAMLPAPLLEAKDVTTLFCVLRVMALAAALTVNAPALTAAVCVTAPAASMVTVPPVMPARASGPPVLLRAIAPVELADAKERTKLLWVLSVIGLPAALTVSDSALTAAD